MEILKSKKGKDKLAFNGYIYRKNTTNQGSQNWRCERKFCKGTASTHLNYHEVPKVTELQRHNHTPDPTKEQMARAINLMMDEAEARTTNSPPREIISDDSHDTVLNLTEEATCLQLLLHKRKSLTWKLQNKRQRLENPFELSTSNQMVKSPETTMGPMDLLLPPNFETDALEQTDFAVSNDIENVEEMKEEIQEDPIDCQMQQIMVNENQSPEMIHQGVPDSVIMETYQPSSKRLLVVPEHQYSMMSSLALMWKKQKMCDASIGNGTTIIMVHKVVLLAISPTLLSSSEVRNNCFLRVNFPANISENAMRAFAEYMYNGVLDLDPLTLTQLQQISYQLGIEDLRLLCESHLCSQTTQVSSSSIDNMLYPGTSLPPHLTTQSDSSSVQRKYSSSTEIKKKSLMSTSWQQSGQDFVSHGPVIIKTEPEDAVPDYPIMQTHPTRSTTAARSVSKMTHSQGSSVTKSSKTLKTFQEPSRTVTVESQHVSHIKLEPVEHSESEHDQHRRTLSSNTSTSNCPPTKIDPSPRATSNCSNSIKLTSGNSSYQSKFARNQTKNVTATQRLPSPGSKVVPLSRDESNMIALDGNNCFNNSTVRSKSNTSDMPYPVMLFSSELETLPLNVSKTVTKAEHYVDLTSS